MFWFRRFGLEHHSLSYFFGGVLRHSPAACELRIDTRTHRHVIASLLRTAVFSHSELLG